MLGLAPEHVLIDRAFDELGLDSLAMLELRGNLERRIACPIPLDLIPADFSIARLVAAITSSNNSPLPSGATTAGVTAPNVLPLSRMTAGRPLVCLPSILGDFAALRPLVRHLEDNTIATVGLDLTPLRGTARESIPDRAARAVRALCARWTGGPYALIGHSFGGLLAYEVARQLEAGGAEVELVAIVDIQSDAHGAFSAHILDKAECLATVAKLIARSGRPTLEEPVQVARHFAASGVPLESSGLAALAARYQANRMALSEYRPTPSQSLPLLLLRSARRHPDDDFLPDAKRSMVDPSWGWQDLTSATVTPVLLPGDHLTMLAEPHVGALAGNLVLRLPRGVAHAAQVDRTKGATAHHVAI
jgi:thioesterase domain-containing protein/acyl carrier protein